MMEFRISDFGFRISDFGLWIEYSDIVASVGGEQG